MGGVLRFEGCQGRSQVYSQPQDAFHDLTHEFEMAMTPEPLP